MSFCGHTYDANGNTTSKTDSTGTTNYAWDFEDRLASATLPGSGGTVSYAYDAWGRRVYKSSSSGTSVYAYDGYNVIEETNAAGAAVARYSQGENVDEPLAGLRSGTTSYYEAETWGQTGRFLVFLYLLCHDWHVFLSLIYRTMSRSAVTPGNSSWPPMRNAWFISNCCNST